MQMGLIRAYIGGNKAPFPVIVFQWLSARAKGRLGLAKRNMMAPNRVRALAGTQRSLGSSS